MAGYATRVKHDIARWREAGLIDAATAEALSLDIGKKGSGGVNFATVLSMMAAALFAAAILIFIAANWEAMPRLLRVGMLFTAIAAGYLGGAALKLNGHTAFGEGAWIVAAAAFGASIALIGQMYHLSGDEVQAIFVWCAGTALAAAALRSGALTVGAALLAGAWLLTGTFSRWWSLDAPLSYLLLAAVLYALSFWTRSLVARHLLLLSVFLFACLYYGTDESFVVPVVLAVASIALFAFARLRPDEADRFLGLGPGLPVQALVGFLTGIGIIQIALVDEPGFVLPSIAAFAGIVAALLVAGRGNRALRWIAYAAFIFQLGFIYIVMLGSMLGTAGFFVVGGLVLSGLAWLITRLERRLSGPPAAEGGAS